MKNSVKVRIQKCNNPENPKEYGFDIHTESEAGANGNFWIESEKGLKQVVEAICIYLKENPYDSEETLLMQFLSNYSPADNADEDTTLMTSEDIKAHLAPFVDIPIEKITQVMLDRGYHLKEYEYRLGWAMLRSI